MSDEPFRAGSEHTITGIIRDNGQPLDLTGAAIVLKLRLNESTTIKILTATADPDQVTNKGKYSYVCTQADIDILSGGKAYLQAWVTTGGKLHKSMVAWRHVEASLQ